MNAATLEAVLPLLEKAKSDGHGGFTALCPAHDDHNPSLSIRRGDKQGVVAKCHAGCEQRAVMTALGLGSAPSGASSTDVTTYYDYHDENDVVLYRAVRKTPIGGGKKFYQQRADGQGSWINSMGDVRRVPYRLPELIEAVALEKQVYVVEGEKDANTAKEYGLVATTNIGGAGKWGDDLSPHLSDADVVILPDNDEPGRDHAEKVARSLDGIARSIRVVALPGLVLKGDLTDWFCEGHTIEELDRIVANVMPWTPKTETSTPRIHLFDDEEIQDIPEPEWIVPGMIPGDALVQLFGPSESMKTFVALDLSCHIVTGLDWHGHPVLRGNVAYVMAEGIHGAKHRVAAWKKYHGVSGKIGLYFVRHRIEVTPDSEDLKALFEAIHAQLPAPPVLVVIDTLARNMKGNENDTRT